MSCWPLIERELVQALRRGRSVKRRSFTALIAVGVTGLYLVAVALSGDVSGRTLHLVLFFLGLYVAMAESGEAAAGLFVQERSNGTLGLLFLSGLTAGEVFAGKLAGAVAIVAYNLLAIIPVIALPFFMGGVSVTQFVVSSVALPVLMLLMVATAVLASTLSRDEGQSFTLSLVFIAVVGGVPMLLDAGNGVFGAHPAMHLSAFSPIYAPVLIIRGLTPLSAGFCWLSLGTALFWALVALVGAVLVLKHHWRLQVAGPVASRWQSTVRKLYFGTASWRMRLRETVLDYNPMSWLMMRERRPAVFAVLSLIMCCVFWLLGWWLWPSGWLNGALFLFEAVVLAIILDTHVRYAAGRPFVESRRDGTIELLLTTPLEIRDVVDGVQTAVHETFIPVIRIYRAAFVVLMLGGLIVRGWTPGAFLDDLIVWAWLFYWLYRIGRANCVRTMWVALNTGRSGLGAWRSTRGNRFGTLYVLYSFYRVAAIWLHTGKLQFTFPTGSDIEIVLTVFLSVIVVLFVAAFENNLPEDSLRVEMIVHFRDLVMEPLPAANDPRLKNWDQSKRLPPHWSAFRIEDQRLRRGRAEPVFRRGNG